jgi:hypothetical protein
MLTSDRATRLKAQLRTTPTMGQTFPLCTSLCTPLPTNIYEQKCLSGAHDAVNFNSEGRHGTLVAVTTRVMPVKSSSVTTCLPTPMQDCAPDAQITCGVRFVQIVTIVVISDYIVHRIEPFSFSWLRTSTSEWRVLPAGCSCCWRLLFVCMSLLYICFGNRLR